MTAPSATRTSTTGRMTQSGLMRDLSRLPKAHLHLHFTGAMRLETLVDLAQASRTRLPSSFIDGDPLRVPADHRGWFRFQRAYDTARHLVTTEETMRRIVLEAALDDVAPPYSAGCSRRPRPARWRPRSAGKDLRDVGRLAPRGEAHYSHEQHEGRP